MLQFNSTPPDFSNFHLVGLAGKISQVTAEGKAENARGLPTAPALAEVKPEATDFANALRVMLALAARFFH